jgi:hypothetical protein
MNEKLKRKIERLEKLKGKPADSKPFFTPEDEAAFKQITHDAIQRNADDYMNRTGADRGLRNKGEVEKHE